MLVRASEAERLDRYPGGTISLLAEIDIAGGSLSSHRSTFRDGFDGAPPHLHRDATELFYVLDGALEVLIGEEIVIIRSGDFLVVEPGTPHAFAAARGSDADVLFVFAPRCRTLRLLPPARRAHVGDSSWQEVADSSDRFDNHYVESATWTGSRS